MKKLFVVRVSREAFVLAENETEAAKAGRDIERWEDFHKTDVFPWSGVNLDGWDDTCLVYGTDEDTTLGAAKEVHEAWKASRA